YPPPLTDSAGSHNTSRRSANQTKRAMDRRSFLTRAGAVAGVSATFPAPAIAQGARELKMVTSWPQGLPGPGTSAERLARAITANTGGRLKVQVFGAGQLVSAFEVFDSVSGGVPDMSHSADYYWEKRSPGSNFFAAVPSGFTADEMAAWIHFGGGQELWDELAGGFTPSFRSRRSRPERQKASAWTTRATSMLAGP